MKWLVAVAIVLFCPGSPAAEPPASTGPLPAGVRFTVKAAPAYLEGGIDSGSDEFTFMLVGDAKGIRQIRRVEYAVSSVEQGDRLRNFYLDGGIPRDRWPITAKITWRNGKVTHAKLAPP
jgi:hypothetical protein